MEKKNSSGSITLASTWTGSTWLDQPPAGKKEEKTRNIGELGEKQALGSLEMEPGGMMGFRSGVSGMSSWEGIVQGCLWGSNNTSNPGWTSLCPHP